MTFTINAENNITAHATLKQAEAVEGGEHFRNEAGLVKLAGTWPIARLVEIWNSLPGVAPVKKFKDRPTGVSRIWKAIQELDLAAPALAEPVAEEPAASESIAEPAVATEATPTPEGVPTAAQETPQSPDVAPEQASATKKASRAKKAPNVAQNATAPREGSKTTKVLELMKRKGGVTLKEIMTARTGRPTASADSSAGPSARRWD